jgi:2-oxoglutarate ferredoxin oxidoreductase subunit gamma
MSRVEIKIGGFGGQGVILAGMIIGKAASIYDDKDATLTQSFGPEARGGSCSAQVVVNTVRNLYPMVTQPDVLVVMSQPAYVKFVGEVKPGALILFDDTLVQVDDLPEGCRAFGIPATRFAEELGRRMVLNIIMVGFFAALGDICSVESVKQAVLNSVPKGTEKLNLNAFERGYSYGLGLKTK